MAWFKVDDGFYTSPKVLMIPRENRFEAIGAWVIAGTWSADKMTDGYVPEYVLTELGISQHIIDLLCTVGLWKCENDGLYKSIHFHDWEEYQPTKEQLNQRREARSLAGSKGGKASAEQRRSKAQANASDLLEHGEANVNPEPEPEPIKDNVQPAVEQKFYTDDFETFWKAYPRRQQKGDAFKAWEQLRKKKLLPDLTMLVMAAESYARNVTEPKYTKLPAGWLRNHAWEDEHTTVKVRSDIVDMRDNPLWGTA